MTSQNGKSTNIAAAARDKNNGTNKNETKNSSDGIQHKAIVYMILLAIQFGIQPIITRRYTSSTINKSTVLLVQELIKGIMAYGMLLLSGDTSTAMQGTSSRKLRSVPQTRRNQSLHR